MSVIQISGLVQDSIVDGPGLRLTIFAQGCPHRCSGCHNPETHDPAGGAVADTADIIAMMEKNPLLDGVTISGGEPFAQAGACAEIAGAARSRGLSVWLYSGYAFEELLKIAKNDPGTDCLLHSADVLVDGRFILAERSLSIPWRGSRNQRVLDLKKSLESGIAVTLMD